MYRSAGLKAVVVGLLIVSCGAVALCAAELHVPAAYGGIQEAVTAAVTGDIIIVAAGEYGGVSIGNKTGITLRGENGAIIRGRLLVNNGTDLVIEGFQITSPTEGILVMGEVCNLTIKNNEIVTCGTQGILFRENGWYCNILIEDNRIAANGYDGLRLLGRWCCEVETSCCKDDGEEPFITIRLNEIVNNGRLSATGVGIRIGPDFCAPIVIEDNTITGNSFAGIHPA